MREKLDAVIKAVAFVCLLVFAIFGSGAAAEGNAQAAYAYVAAMAWVVIYLVMGEEDEWTG